MFIKAVSDCSDELFSNEEKEDYFIPPKNYETY